MYLEKILELTPKTAEASTVPEPFGKPGGPGLWHHKDMQLPPYIQHVAHELVKSGHDESEAIHMAVGIVKNWARGHSGKGHVHPDVQAAAAKNIAKWEALKAQAHTEHAAKDAKDSKTTNQALEQVVALAKAYEREERGRVEQVGAYDKLKKALTPGTGPSAGETHQTGQKVWLDTVTRPGSPKVNNYDVAHQIGGTIQRLETTRQAHPWQLGGMLNPPIQTLHAAMVAMMEKNYELASQHLSNASAQLQQVNAGDAVDNDVRAHRNAVDDFVKYHPRTEGAYDVMPHRNVAPKKTKFKSHGVRIGPFNFQRGAIRNAASLDETVRLAAEAGRPAGTLQHAPAQTVQAGPPLPPGAKPPKPQDLVKLASDIEADGDDSPHTTAAVKHLRAGAMVLETGDNAGALRMLRSAQTDVAALMRDRQNDARDSMKGIAASGYGGTVPPAELSSMRSEMVRHMGKVGKARQHSARIAKHIDAIRRTRPAGVHGEAPH